MLNNLYYDWNVFLFYYAFIKLITTSEDKFDYRVDIIVRFFAVGYERFFETVLTTPEKDTCFKEWAKYNGFTVCHRFCMNGFMVVTAKNRSDPTAKKQI